MAKRKTVPEYLCPRCQCWHTVAPCPNYKLKAKRKTGRKVYETFYQGHWHKVSWAEYVQHSWQKYSTRVDGKETARGKA